VAYDALIRGGAILDGSGAPARRADIGVENGWITAIGDLHRQTAGLEIDAVGLTVTPGFIDTHTHSDAASYLPDQQRDIAAAALRQGVTTEVCGNCGFSPFPAPPGTEGRVARHTGILGGPIEWHDLEGFAARVEARGLFANLAPLVGHGTLRAVVIGFEDRAPEPEELKEMRRLAEEALEQGAFGLSSGLIYSPAVYAGTGELVEIARALASYGRPYTTHIRGETEMLLESVAEAIEIGRRAGVAVHISHHKAAGRPNWGRTADSLEMIERAREGRDVTLDVYPYTAGSTRLFALLPPWAQDGGVGPMLERLADRETRRRIATDLGQPSQRWENLALAAGWDAIQISACPARPDTEGRRVDELAGAAGKEPLDFVCDLLVEAGGNASMILHMMDEADVRRVLAHPAATIGSDGIPQPGKPHPRWAGTFARVLGRYTREERLLELPEAVRKMTSAAAGRFGLRDRGRLAPGMVADLVVFDPALVADSATYEDPLLPPTGIRHVLLGGRLAVRDGELTSERLGRVLRAG
jgi:N-acyl-D-amino-acid deacylase